MTTIAQINLNNSRYVQDLMHQVVVKMKISLIAVSEPNICPQDSRWATSLSGRAAIYIASCAPNGTLLYRGRDHVIVRWASIVVVSVYFTPSSTIQAFQDSLEALGEIW